MGTNTNQEKIDAAAQLLYTLNTSWAKISAAINDGKPQPLVILNDREQFEAMAKDAGANPSYLPSHVPGVGIRDFIHQHVMYVLVVVDDGTEEEDNENADG